MAYKLVLLLMHVVLLTGCIYQYDVTTEPRMSNLMGRKAELTQDLFLMNAVSPDGFNATQPAYELIKPNFGTSSPESVSCYDEYGLDWQHHDKNQMAYRQQQIDFGSRGRFPIKADAVIDIIRKGTQISIVKAEERVHCADFTKLVVFAYIDHPKYRGKLCKLVGLFNFPGGFDMEQGLELDPCYLKYVD